MIVNYTDNGWEVVTQRAHGMVAAQLAVHWHFAHQPAHWLETILAIAEHDDAEVELDGEHLLTATGGPLNYSMKLFDARHCTKLAEMAITKSRYIALLTSMHMDFLYKKEASKNPKARTFLSEQRRLRHRWCKEIGMDDQELARLYSLMEWCDACSLLICQRQLPPEQRGVEISRGATQKTCMLHQLDDRRLTIDPWPFSNDRFAVHYEYRVLEPVSFPSSAAFRKCFLSAPVSLQTWMVERR